MHKKILLFLLIILLTGCTSKYHLTISNDSFSENINIVIPKSEIPTSSGSDDVELDDRVTPFLNDKTFAYFDERKSYYKKNVEYGTTDINVNMKYNYTANSFKNSMALNKCFSNFKFETKNNYDINAYGKFYCLYSDTLDIEIETKNKVLDNNADEIDGNIYIWHITEDNQDNVNIKFVVAKGFPVKSITRYTLLIIFVGIISFIIYSYFKIKKKKVNGV